MNSTRKALVILSVLAWAAGARAASDVVFADFEGKDYGAWKAEGTAFGKAPAAGTLPIQMKVDGFHGKGLVNSFNGGDKATGKLTSPEFAIERKFITFLIGGGGWEGKTCMNLLVDGKIVRTATGPNTKPGGSEALAPQWWYVSEFAGKSAHIEIVDVATGGWGHINVDYIVFSDQKPAALLTNVAREFALDHRYLNLPVKNGATKRRMSVSVASQVVREFDIELADAAPDWWAALDLNAWQGQAAVLRVDKLPENSEGLKNIEPSSSPKGREDLYHEKLRPQFHFSPARGWNNDPNGMVFAQGEWHLFFQHNPYGWAWGNMHWGHAVSRDLLHWEELPIAIYPRQFGDWVFSGSAVVDKRNTSGWKKGANDLLVAAFTSTGRGECIAYSNDRGRTWQELEGNPVVKHKGRDPKLIWHEPTKRWVMCLYDEVPKPGDAKITTRNIAFYTSADLKKWEFQSRIEGFYECPDLFELPVDGKAANKKWVLTAASSEYMIGKFDGKKFTPESPKLTGTRGDAFYAAQTFSDSPAGRRIQIGWFRSGDRSMPFNQMMSVPLEVTLRTTPDRVRLHWQPIAELERLRGEKHVLKDVPLKPDENPLAEIKGDLLDINVDLDCGEAKEVGFKIHGVPVTYDVDEEELRCQDRTVPLASSQGRIRLRVLVDRLALEIFAGDGAIYMPMKAVAKPDDKSLELYAKGGTAQIRSLEVHELRSIWPAVVGQR